MKKLLVFAMLLATVLSFAAKGPIVDKVYIDVKMDIAIGLKDAVEGKTDIFFYGVDGPQYNGLAKADKDKLSTYTIPSGSWSLMVNPIPNAAPYTWTVKSGETFFNPLAMKEIRFALNFIISRKYLVDEILGGAGGAMFTPMTPGQPGTYKYNLIATKYGMTAQGNEKKAITDINAAMEKAAALPENKGKLVKKDGWWLYNNKPVTIKFLIRVDDPQGRLKAGRYVADQIEKSGIKVERLEYDRSKCSKLTYNGDPADYEWGLYTEGWGAGATRAFWDITIAQMYSPWYGYMAGGAVPEFWNYKQNEIDALSQKIFNGLFLTEEEYWTDNLRATELGLEDSARIYLAYQDQYFAANKDRFNNRVVYGLGDGLNRWAHITADVKPDSNGQKVLRLTQYSAKGSLFMSAWDPIGVDGFNDTYSQVISDPLYDSSYFEAPNSAKDTAYRAFGKDVVTKVEMNGDKLVGTLQVPADAIKYNSMTKKWEKVGSGVTSFSKATYSFKFGKWHSGRPIGIADIMYVQAFLIEWMNKDGATDKYYEPTYESLARSQMETFKGYVVNRDNTITVYFDFNFPLDPDRVAATGAPWLKLTPAGVNVSVSWEIAEAMAKLVAEGSKSGTVYSFSSDPAFTEIDALSPKCVADIKAKLEEMKAAKYVPASVKDYMTSADAVSSYEAAINFINNYGHAYISNGPFYLSKFDTTNNFAELTAFRDESYPYEAGYWNKYFATTRTRIDKIEVPATASKGKDVKVTVKLSTVEYPSDVAKLADSKAKVNLILITKDKEITYTAKYVSAGTFEVTISGADTKNLTAGSYTIVVEGQLLNEAPAVESSSLVIF